MRRHPRLVILGLAVISVTSASSGCFRQTAGVEFPTDQVQQRASDVQALGEEIRIALEEVEFEMSEAFGDVPEDAFSSSSLALVRYSLLSCFTEPLCEPGDELPICVRRHDDYDPSSSIAVQLDERGPVYGYRPCGLPISSGFVDDVDAWSEPGLLWFRRRVILVDSLRVRLKALIPARLEELDVRLDNYDVDLKQLNNRAEDAWRESQRVEKRSEHRRRDEELWERFRTEMLELEESLALIRLDVDRLREHQRRDIRDVAVRIATLGADDF